MKKLCILALTLVLTAALFAGCGCTNRNRPTTPTSMPTAPTILPTETTQVPTTHATQPSTHETYDNGNGLLEDDATGITDATDGTVEGGARGAVPHNGR